MPEQTLHCAFAIDDKYSRHLGATLASVLENNRNQNISAHIITMGVSEQNRQLLRDFVRKYPGASISFYEFDADKYAHFRVDRHISLASYIRLFLGELLPASIERVLYLDCDLAILSDLGDLLHFPMDDFVIAAAPDIWAQENEHERLGLNKNYVYFNAGVLLVNLSEWRRLDCQSKLVDFVEKNFEILLCHDQDALNACLNTKVKYLDLVWNYQAFFQYYLFRPLGYTRAKFLKIRNEKKIIHYTTPRKPWFYASDAPFEKMYLKYLKKTPWKGAAQADKTFQKVMQRYGNRGSELVSKIQSKLGVKVVANAAAAKTP